MYILLSGEGPGDIGACEVGADCCAREQFTEGPMAVIVDQLIEQSLDYDMSHLDCHRVSFVSEGYLKSNCAPRIKKPMSLRGKKKPAETKYFYENARALAVKAEQLSKEVNDVVIAILFRDSDGTASAGRGLWADKRNSVQKGFSDANYEFGVAMIPKPKSEAWLLCASSKYDYRDCEKLEHESGNDKAPNPLKSQLNDALDGQSSSCRLKQMLKDRQIVAEKISMPSFNAFKSDLKDVVARVTAGH
ncbi:hypothetical protein IDSA_11470 [Pseudidiomarina salinarum]|uniref:Uncharacterized protein n=1 Tax=Pseudidiomarina salinarum TaxID=435908 RepID=A0A094IWG6_9GAMM|nr:hypothetical protein [Pseudidiomarina salinarum]KFZ30174.1 hypothetical protein IDSA_11470 [Pseudidiomarina salinarum]RUO68676.1 hypothetical protein CWI79_11455 [Pseudidiomarina salinarum]